MSIDVRLVRPDEYPAYIDAVSTGFLERPDVERLIRLATPGWDPARVWGAFDGDRVCGTFRSWATELTVPGGATLVASAIAGVSVLPTYRRRGVLSALAAAEHAAIRERGEVVGLLYASEWPIYGRFGYGSGCRNATWTLAASRTSFHGGATTRIELVTPDDAAIATVKEVYEAWRVRQPGEIRRRDLRWEDDLGMRENTYGHTWRGFLAIHRGPDGQADGYARYRAEEKWVDRQPASVVHVDELHALTPDANAALWRFLAEIDLVATLRAEGRSPSDPLPWLLTNARAAAPSDIGDGMWVRLFDVRRALEARTYGREASVVIDVVDGELGSPLRIALDASPAGSTCAATDRSPDISLPVAALGAAYLGGTRLRNATIATGADEHTPGALVALDALLRTPDEPWCSTFF